MGKKKYYITDGRRQIGPLDIKTLEQMVLNCQMSMFDLVMDANTKQWTPFNQLESSKEELNPEYSSTQSRINLKASKTQTKSIFGLDPGNFESSDADANSNKTDTNPSKTDANSNLNSNPKPIGPPKKSADLQKWFTKQGKFVEGPYTFIEILAMIKEGSLTEHDSVKMGANSTWVLAKNCPEFSSKQLAKFQLELAQELSKQKLFRRTDRRTQTDQIIWFHSSQGTIMVRLNDVSFNGASLNCPTPLTASSPIVLFLNSSLWAAKGSVVSCKLIKENNDQWYNIRVHLTETTEEWKDWVDLQASAA